MGDEPAAPARDLALKSETAMAQESPKRGGRLRVWLTVVLVPLTATLVALPFVQAATEVARSAICVLARRCLSGTVSARANPGRGCLLNAGRPRLADPQPGTSTGQRPHALNERSPAPIATRSATHFDLAFRCARLRPAFERTFQNRTMK